MKTTATTEAVSSHPGENGCWSQEWRRNTSRAGQKPMADWKNDSQTYEAGRESQKPPTLVVGNKPNGKCQIMTLAEMPLPISKNILLEAMNDKRFDESIRYPVAAALVRLDDQSARDVLLDGLDKYLAPDQDTLESSRHNFAFYELQKLGDAKLISAIEAKAAVATRKRLQLVLPALVERMRINNLPVDELKRIATEEKNLNRRWPAIEVLGETGKADDLPFLESLLPLAKKYRGLQGQRNNFVRVVEAAIRNVRLHNWEQFENKP